MKLPLDTNILLEVLLSRQKADESQALLQDVEVHSCFLTDFGLHSIGFILFRRKLHNTFFDFVNELLVKSGMTIVSLSLEDLNQVIEAAKKHRLDFDDAYQYVAAEKLDLTLVSFDADFDRTERGRRTPADIVGELQTDEEALDVDDGGSPDP